MRTFITALLATFLTSSFGQAEPPRFEPHDIGSLVGLSTRAMALNDQGDVVGYSVTGPAGPESEPFTNAFLYSNTDMRDLFEGEHCAVSVATAVNERKEIVGYCRLETLGYAQPFYYSEPTGVMVLNPFGAEPLNATGAAYGINESGEMVGNANEPSAGDRAFLMSSPTAPGIDLTPALSPPYYASGASAVNDSGQIVGALSKSGPSSANDYQDSFLLDGASFTNLDEVLTQDPEFSNANFVAKAINGAGVVVGYVGGTGRPVQAFVYDNGKFVDLETPSGEFSWGYGIDSAGRVVGDATLGGGSVMHAFLWENGAMYDLNDLVAPRYGIVLTNARAVNDVGQIVAWGYEESDTGPNRIVRSYLLTPTSTTGEIEDLIDFIEGLGLQHGTENSLIVKLEHAIDALDDGDTEGACSLLGAFIHEVEAQSGKKISEDDAAFLIDEATRLRASLGCS